LLPLMCTDLLDHIIYLTNKYQKIANESGLKGLYPIIFNNLL